VEATPQHAEAARRKLLEVVEQQRRRRGEGGGAAAEVLVLAGRASEVMLPPGFCPDLVIGELLGYTASEEGAPAIFAQLHRRLGRARAAAQPATTEGGRAAAGAADQQQQQDEVDEGSGSLPPVLPRAARSLLLPVRPLHLALGERWRNWRAHGWWPRLEPGRLYDCRNFPAHLEFDVSPQVWEEFHFGRADLEDQLVQGRTLELQGLPAGEELGGLLLWMQTDVDEGLCIDTRRDFTSWNHYYLHLPPQRVPADGSIVVRADVDARTEDVRYRFQVGAASFDSHA